MNLFSVITLFVLDSVLVLIFGVIRFIAPVIKKRNCNFITRKILLNVYIIYILSSAVHLVISYILLTEVSFAYV